MDIAKRIARRRRSLGLSQEGLALKAAIGRATVARIESGRAAEPKTLQAIASALDIPLVPMLRALTGMKSAR